MKPLEKTCPFCGAEPGAGCVDPKTGEPYPEPHRGRVIAAQTERDAPALAVANAAVAVREPRPVERTSAVARVARLAADEPPIALGVTCPNCGAEQGQPCVDKVTGEPKDAPCRIRKQAALGHSIEGV